MVISLSHQAGNPINKRPATIAAILVMALFASRWLRKPPQLVGLSLLSAASLERACGILGPRKKPRTIIITHTLLILHKPSRQATAALAAARNRPDQARSVISKRPSQFADALHQRIVRDGEIRPDRGKELALRDKTAGVFDEVMQERRSLAERQPRSRQAGGSCDPNLGHNDRIAVALTASAPNSPHREWSSLSHPVGNKTSHVGCRQHGATIKLTQDRLLKLHADPGSLPPHHAA